MDGIGVLEQTVVEPHPVGVIENGYALQLFSEEIGLIEMEEKRLDAVAERIGSGQGIRERDDSLPLVEESLGDVLARVAVGAGDGDAQDVVDGDRYAGASGQGVHDRCRAVWDEADRAVGKDEASAEGVVAPEMVEVAIVVKATRAVERREGTWCAGVHPEWGDIGVARVLDGDSAAEEARGFCSVSLKFVSFLSRLKFLTGAMMPSMMASRNVL